MKEWPPFKHFALSLCLRPSKLGNFSQVKSSQVKHLEGTGGPRDGEKVMFCNDSTSHSHELHVSVTQSGAVIRCSAVRTQNVCQIMRPSAISTR